MSDDAAGHPLQAEVTANIRQIVDTVAALTRLPSRWNGTVQIRGMDFGHAGQKHRSCGISLRVDVLVVPAYRWSTMIHEALHSLSGGFTEMRSDVAADQWEEAIVEQVQRLVRPTVLRVLGVDVPREDLEARDLAHPYNQQIRRLEAVRGLLQQATEPFYLALLAASTRERARILVDALRGRPNGEGGRR